MVVSVLFLSSAYRNPSDWDDMASVDAVGPSSAGTHSTTSPLTWTHICAATANLIVVGVNLSNGLFTAVTAVTYGGLACTLIPGAQVYAGNTGTAGPAQMFARFNPPTGSNTVSVTTTGGNDVIGGSVSVIGASGSFGTAVKGGSSGGSAAASVAVPGTTTGGIVFNMVQSGSGVTSATAPNIRQYLTNAGTSTAADNSAMGTDPSTGGTVTPAWVLVNDTNAIVAVEILPSGGIAGLIPQQLKQRAAYQVLGSRPFGRHLAGYRG